MFFDRYTSDISCLRNALNKKDVAYCNPSDYYVTEEECIKYLDEIEVGQANNDKWNTKRRERVVRTTLILCFIGSIILIFVSLYFLHVYVEGWEILLIPISWIIIGTAIGIFNWVNEEFRSNYIWRSSFFPPVNYKIEKLFDDYLWRVYLREEESHNNKEVHKPCE